jgi:hypothetical protein
MNYEVLTFREKLFETPICHLAVLELDFKCPMKEISSHFSQFCLLDIMKYSLALQIFLNPFDFKESSAFDFLICKFLVLLLLRLQRILFYYNISQKLRVTIQKTGYLCKVLWL